MEKTMDERLNSLEMMANVNKVEGFDPTLVTTCYEDAEGNARMYLQAEPAMLWFRMKHPGGRLEQVLHRVNDQQATVEGRVIDENGNLLANAFATRRNSDDQFGKDYVQNAGTAAIRKALGNCGFGTPANATFIDGVTPLIKAAELPDAPVDSGVNVKIIPPIPKMDKKIMVEDDAEPKKAKPTTEQEPKPKAKQKKIVAPKPTVKKEDATAKTVETVNSAKPVVEPQKETQTSENTEVQEKPGEPISNSQAENPLEAAKKRIITFGRFNGVTLEEIANGKERKLLNWFLTSCSVDKDVKEDVKRVIDQDPIPKNIEEAYQLIVPDGDWRGKTMKEVADADDRATFNRFLKPEYKESAVYVAAQMIAGQRGF